MTIRRLRPSLASIEARLCGPSDALVQRWLAGEALSDDLRLQLESDPEAQIRRQRLQAGPQVHTANEDDATAAATSSDRPARPDLLLQFSRNVRGRLAAARATFEPTPAPGQVREVQRLLGVDGSTIPWDFPRPLAVLLRAPASGHSTVWQGWMVSPDTDYACYWDMVLEPQDEPMDPRASIVQAWNSVLIDIRGVGPVIGVLSPERLSAVAVLADDFVRGPSIGTSGAQPGTLVQRSLGGRSMVTGTPYGAHGTDPRLDYQSLYHSAAEPVRQHARAILDLESARPATRTAQIYQFPVKQHAQRQRVHAEVHDTIAMAAGDAAAGSPNAWLLEDRLRLVLHVQPTADGATIVCQLTLEAGEPVVVQLVGEISGPRIALATDGPTYRSPPFAAGADVTLEISGLVSTGVVRIPLVPGTGPDE